MIYKNGGVIQCMERDPFFGGEYSRKPFNPIEKQIIMIAPCHASVTPLHIIFVPTKTKPLIQLFMKFKSFLKTEKTQNIKFQISNYSSGLSCQTSKRVSFQNSNLLNRQHGKH